MVADTEQTAGHIVKVGRVVHSKVKSVRVCDLSRFNVADQFRAVICSTASRCIETRANSTVFVTYLLGALS